MARKNADISAVICRQSTDILVSLLGYDPSQKSKGELGYAAGTGRPETMFGYLKHLWSISGKNGTLDAYSRCFLR
jgi:hypothetical protein